VEGIDYLVLTAANSSQASGYRRHLADRKRDGQLAGVAQCWVIADPNTNRLGSGGATLVALLRIVEDLARRQTSTSDFVELLSGQRMIVIHSGGESRRLGVYASEGKIFAPLPCQAGPENRPATLFDLILGNLRRLQPPREGHLLIASGDALLSWEGSPPNLGKGDVVGLFFPGTPSLGARHGVFRLALDGHVVDYQQKPDAGDSRRQRTAAASEVAFIDSGIVSFRPSVCAQLLSMAGARLRRGRVEQSGGLLHDLISGRCPGVDLYREILVAMSPRHNRTSYLLEMEQAGVLAHGDRVQRRRLSGLFSAIHGNRLQAESLPCCDFLHLDTIDDLLDSVTTLNRTGQRHGFRNLHRALVRGQRVHNEAVVYNSVIDAESVQLGQRVFIESSHIRGKSVSLPGRNVVVGWPREAGFRLALPENWSLVCLPVRGKKWAAMAFGGEDDFKTPRQDGGSFGNAPMDEFLGMHHIPPERIWTRNHMPETLHNAKLWTIGTIEEALRGVLWMCRTEGKEASHRPDGWLESRRVCAAHLMRIVDHSRIIDGRAEIQRLVEIEQIGARLADEPRLATSRIVDQIRGRKEACNAVAQLNGLLSPSTAPLVRARAAKLVESIGKKFPAAFRGLMHVSEKQLSRVAFDAIAEAVQRQIATAESPREAAILPDQVCWATCPARLDLAGGWSDTPPICTELGGAVVNSAIMLNGQYPIQVIAKLSDEPKIALSSIDLGHRIEITDAQSALEYREPGDWAALPKAALVLSGICPRTPKQSLKSCLKTLGGGLELTLFSALPKGSGLGTSSILGAAVLACLARVVGEPVGREALIARTSVLEQMLTTGGGWQDQVGGITHGTKLAQTAPGPEQIPSIRWTGLDMSADPEFASRVLLYFTGQTRLAKNILQNIVGRYLARDSDALRIIDQLKDEAARMKESLDRGDLSAFAAGVDRYWELKKGLDPGATNDSIERILARVDKYLVGKVLPGAGGGGFIFMVARDREAAQKVRQLLNASPPNPHARFFDFEVDHQGLHVTVL